MTNHWNIKFLLFFPQKKGSRKWNQRFTRADIHCVCIQSTWLTLSFAFTFSVLWITGFASKYLILELLLFPLTGHEKTSMCLEKKRCVLVSFQATFNCTCVHCTTVHLCYKFYLSAKWTWGIGHNYHVSLNHCYLLMRANYFSFGEYHWNAHKLKKIQRHAIYVQSIIIFSFLLFPFLFFFFPIFYSIC